MNNKTIATYTLGCKVNQYETNAVEEIFTQNGYTLTDFDDKSDIYIINTCTVTSMSDRKSRQVIRRAKKNNKDAIVVVMGCYAQNDPDAIIKIEDVNLVLGTKDKNKIFEEVQKISKHDKVVRVTNIMDELEFENLSVTSYTKNTRAFVKIQDGCDRYCSYCIIPYTRGRIRSRNISDIVREVQSLSDNGYKEVVLTGIHIASYGKDLKKSKDKLIPIIDSQKDDFIQADISLIDVIEEVSKIKNIHRVRIGSVEPIIISDDFLKRLAKIEKFCHHFHLSLQSGCDDTLKRMNRRYTTDEYRDAVLKIRQYFDSPAITTDIITGFPGETQEEFEKTYLYLSDINLYEMHIFPFSRRSGTKAYDMKNQIDNDTKHKRSEKLIALANKNKNDFEQNLIGKTFDVLFEQKEDEFYHGYTKNYVKIHVKSDKELSGKLIDVRINALENGILIGEIQI
jgi:MiaB-like protein